MDTHEFRARWAGRHQWHDRVANVDESLGGDDRKESSSSSSARPQEAAEELYTAINDFVEHAMEFAIAPIATMFRNAPPPPRRHDAPPRGDHEQEHASGGRKHERGGRWRDSRWRQAREHGDRA